MRVIKLGIISLIVFSIIITIFSLFIPSRVRISRAIDIAADKDSLMNYLQEVPKWKSWYPGADTSVYFFIAGKISGISIGNKKALLLKEKNDSAVFTMYVGQGAGKEVSGWNIYPGHVPNQYSVQWYTDFHFRWYPWEKFSSLLLENRYGQMMEQGLKNLKMVLEK